MKCVVAAVSLLENDLKIEMVEAENWQEALSKHSLFKEDGNPGDVSWLSNVMETAKFEAFHADIMFDVLEIEIGFNPDKNQLPPLKLIENTPIDIPNTQGDMFIENMAGGVGYKLITPSKQVENTLRDIPNKPSSDEPKYKRPYPRDVTDQYIKHDEEGKEKQPEVIQTSQGDMFIEYMVGEVEVIRSVDTGEITCRTCNSGDCTHVEKVKAYLS